MASPDGLKIFYIERAFYSNPQVLLFIAANLDAAEKMFEAQLEKENYRRHQFGELKELDLKSPRLTILEPPGDRSFIH